MAKVFVLTAWSLIMLFMKAHPRFIRNNIRSAVLFFFL